MSFEQLLAAPQYSLRQSEKEPLLLAELNRLTTLHATNCASYERLLRVTGAAGTPDALSEIPYLPVGLFKSHELRSVTADKIFKTLTSSGTTGQQVSQIYLDKETAMRQTAALGAIISRVIGRERLPMVLVESAALIKDRKIFSARAAGLLGMMNFGRQHFYALDEQMNLNEPGLAAFLEKFAARPFLIFGFTFMVWQYFLRRLAGRGCDLSNGILLHSGGWKKLQEMAVSNDEFKSQLRQATGLCRVYNFYGTVEQVGSVYVEGEDGCLYAPNFADVIVRDPVSLQPAPHGTPGILQILSILPLSYPGHSILTEDLGVIHGVDDSSCGRLGKRFSVIGRVPQAELRGCSDVHARSLAS